MKGFKDWLFSNDSWMDMGLILMIAGFSTDNVVGFTLGIVFMSFYVVGRYH